jgi:hypothetical protein
MRWARRDAHQAFDQIWQVVGIARAQAYAELARRLGIPVDQCHIGEMDEAQCARVVRICQAW